MVRSYAYVSKHWNNKGTALYHSQKYQEALAYNKDISIDPNNIAYQQNRAIILKQLGHRLQ
jgi:hypothetical protein